jgi:hypothetical protein
MAALAGNFSTRALLVARDGALRLAAQFATSMRRMILDIRLG